jgi:hypothetical protein
MTERVGLEVDTLTIRIPIRLQRRGGRKLIMTPEWATMPASKPRRDDTLIKALVRAHRWRRRIESGQAKSVTDLAEQEGVTDAAPADLSGTGYRGGDPGRAAPEKLGGRAGKRAAGWDDQRVNWAIAALGGFGEVSQESYSSNDIH